MSAWITIDAVYENGVFRPTQPLSAELPRNVRLIVKSPRVLRQWPTDVAEIYQALADEDRRIAKAMWEDVVATWPNKDEQP